MHESIQAQIQPLQDELNDHRNHCQGTFAAHEEESKDIKSHLQTLRISGTTGSGNSARESEIVIGGFDKIKASKQGAIASCERILRGHDGNPQIILDRVANAPVVIPVKFGSPDAAAAFLRDNRYAKHFEGFWCNINQDRAARQEFNRKVRPLYKIKRAILEKTTITADSIVIRKATQQVFIVDGHRLNWVCTYHSPSRIEWTPEVLDDVKIHAKALIDESAE